MIWPFKKRPARFIYKYFDGTKERCDDPLAIRHRLDTHSTYRFDVHPVLAEKGDAAAYEIVLTAICDAFQVSRFDSATGKGLTQTELIGLLVDFGNYLEAVKKNIFTLPNFTSSTEGATSSRSSEPTTSNTSA